LQTVSAHAHEVAAANKRAVESQRRADQADSARIAAEEQARQATVWLAKLKVRLATAPLQSAVTPPVARQSEVGSKPPPCWAWSTLQAEVEARSTEVRRVQEHANKELAAAGAAAASSKRYGARLLCTLCWTAM
jgi:hypothetical protein